VPQTITVVPQEIIETQSATTLRDVLRNVPGITFQAGEGGTPAGDQLTIRGFSARTDIFIDGSRDFGGYSRDSFNLEQVEVVKGPSSATVGRGSTGGSVNLVSKSPNLSSSRSTILSGGSASTMRGAFDINQSVKAIEGAAVRMNVMWQDAGVPGRDVTDSRRWGLAPSIAFGLGKPTGVTVSYFKLDQEGVPDYGLPYVPATNIPLAQYANQAPPIDYSNFYGMRERDYENTTTDVGTVAAHHDTQKFSIRQQLRYGRTLRDSMITAPRFVSNTSTDIRRTDWKSRDQAARIASSQTDLTMRFNTKGVGHSVVSGVEFSRESDINYTRIETGPAAPDTDLFNPNPNDTYVGGLARNGAFTEGVAISKAAYAFDTAKVGKSVELTGGVRFESFDVDYDSAAVNGTVTTLGRTDTMASWRGGIVYKPTPSGSVYASAGTSMNPSAEGLSLTTATVNLEPERTHNYEAGTKWDVLRNRLSVVASLFRTEKSNARTPGINAGDPPTVLQGTQRVDGVELGLSGRVTKRWQIFGGYAFMKSKIVKTNTAADLSNDLTLTPNNTLNVWSDVALPWHLSAGAGVQYMDQVFRNTANTTEVPSYWLVNGMAAREINRHLTLRLNVNNLTGAKYADRTSGGHFIPGPGRSVLVNTAFRF
jgi:catecholate siderophore receptor